MPRIAWIFFATVIYRKNSYRNLGYVEINLVL
ncbi:hypothetical protein VITU9109_10127 [Vibrio tubiashii ATCC 19109]|uniref:Uncharacterized protein n=1 Tax=Vibrio tubiashii ATCC 19109 TaxID=1051646 RepID=A0ABN0DDD8_9VIBR|nr:hypothetical protein VITU9109_10127 [Vibrio tubiashii ATCC 19109]